MKKYSEVLRCIAKGSAFDQNQTRFKDISDKKVTRHIINHKYVEKDLIGRYTITQKGIDYLKPRKVTKGFHFDVIQKRLAYIKKVPNQTSKTYRNVFEITDSNFTMLVKNYNLTKSGKRGSYTYSISSHSAGEDFSTSCINPNVKPQPLRFPLTLTPKAKFEQTDREKNK